MRGSAHRLSKFPRHQLVEDDLVRGRARELDLLLALGEPTQESPAAEPNPTFWWDLQWSCGLIVSVQFEQLTERVALKLDQAEVDHALFHLGVEVDDLWTLEADNPVRFSVVATVPDRSWSLWRDDGSGEICDATGLSEREARCRAETATAFGPASRWWATPAT